MSSDDMDAGLRPLPKDQKNISKEKYFCEVCKVWVEKYDWDTEETCPRHIRLSRLVEKKDDKKNEKTDVSDPSHLLVRHHSLPEVHSQGATASDASNQVSVALPKKAFSRSFSWACQPKKTTQEMIDEQKYLESIGTYEVPQLMRQSRSLCQHCKKTNYQIFMNETLFELQEKKVPVKQQIMLVHKKWQGLSKEEKELWKTFHMWTKMQTKDEVIVQSLIAGVEPSWMTNVVHEQNAWKIFQEASQMADFDQRLLESGFFTERDKMIGYSFLNRAWLKLDGEQRSTWICRAKVLLSNNKYESTFDKCHECVRGEDSSRNWREFGTNATLRPANGVNLAQIVYELDKRGRKPTF